MSESETQGRIWRGMVDAELLRQIQNFHSSRHPWGMTKAIAARLQHVEAQLAAKDAVIAGLAGAAQKAYTAMSANDPFSLTVWTEGVDALEAALALAADATKEGR